MPHHSNPLMQENIPFEGLGHLNLGSRARAGVQIALTLMFVGVGLILYYGAAEAIAGTARISGRSPEVQVSVWSFVAAFVAALVAGCYIFIFLRNNFLK